MTTKQTSDELGQVIEELWAYWVKNPKFGKVIRPELTPDEAKQALLTWRDTYTKEQDGVTKLTGDMARNIAQKYLQNIQRIQSQHDIEDLTARDFQRKYDKAEITSEVCLELLDSLILSRYDYLVDNAIKLNAQKKGQ